MTDTLRAVGTVVVHTPVWVWPLYALLLFLAFQRTRDSSLALWRVLVLPLVVTLLAILSFISAGVSALPIILFGLIGGGAAGWQLEHGSDTKRLVDGRLRLGGEWWSFGLMVLVLIFRYVVNVVAAIHPALHANLTWYFGTLFVSAALSALFLGRTAARLHVYFRGAVL